MVNRPPRQTGFPVSLFGTPSALYQQIFYTVLRAGHLQAGPEYGVKRDYYPGYELILCLSGCSSVRVTGPFHDVSPGDMVVFNCHHPHHHQANAEDPWEAYWVRFDGPGMEQICSILSVAEEPVIRGVETAEAVAAYQEIFHQMASGSPEAAPRMHAEVARLIALTCCARQLPPGDLSGPAPLRRVAEHMRQTYFEPHRVEDLARAAGMSSSHFARLFRRAFGTSPLDWLRRERISQAKRRLAETTIPIEWVAEQVGYKDRFFFSKDFRRMTGMTPREYRKREAGH